MIVAWTSCETVQHIISQPTQGFITDASEFLEGSMLRIIHAWEKKRGNNDQKHGSFQADDPELASGMIIIDIHFGTCWIMNGTRLDCKSGETDNRQDNESARRDSSGYLGYCNDEGRTIGTPEMDIVHG